MVSIFSPQLDEPLHFIEEPPPLLFFGGALVFVSSVISVLSMEIIRQGPD